MVKLKNIVKIYNPDKQNEFEALHKVSAEIKDGEMVAVIGKSGAGKSTLLHILACIDSYQEGEYTIDGTLVKALSERQYAKIRNEKIGMVMQDFALVEDFTALENVMIPLNFAKKKIPSKKEKALAALRSVGIEELSTVQDHCIVLLSGSWEESWNINEGNDRYVERIAEAHETSTFSAGIAVEHTSKLVRLVSYDTYRTSIETSESDDDILCKVRLYLEELSVVGDCTDNLVHVVCLVRVVRNDFIE